MSQTLDKLDIHYRHWDDYVRNWRIGKFLDMYLPEPWWGWTPYSGEKLHSVVINLNPGPGGKLQTHRCMNCMWGCSDSAKYSESMDFLRHHLAPTERWHLNRRYKPIMRALGVKDENIAPTTRHHLSIELLPQHGCINLNEYIENNANDICKNVLCFAAKASKMIEPNPYLVRDPELPYENPLKNIVLMRCAPKHLEKISDALIKLNSDYRIQKLHSDSECGIFNLANEKDLKDVLFVCIKGARNNFPGDDKLKGIIKNINLKK